MQTDAVEAMFRGLALGAASRQVVAAATASTLRSLDNADRGLLAQAASSADADIILAARSAHEFLDRGNGAHAHSLAAALRQARDWLSVGLATQLTRLAKSADAVRHVTPSGLSGVLDQLQHELNERGPRNAEHGARRTARAAGLAQRVRSRPAAL